MNFRTQVLGATQTAARFTRLAATAPGRAQAVVMTYAQLLQTQIQANASGRPGPNAPTGDYRRSITIEYENTGTEAVARVGTNKPQGRRLEFGFVGADSLGRVYNQPPYPHFGPAASAISGPFEKAMTAALED